MKSKPNYETPSNIIELPGLKAEQVKLILEKAELEDEEITCVDDASDFFLCFGTSKEEIDCDYLITTYTIKIGKRKFQTSDYQYRKDGGLCDSRWANSFWEVEPKKPKVKKNKVGAWDDIKKEACDQVSGCGCREADIVLEWLEKNYKAPTKK